MAALVVDRIAVALLVLAVGSLLLRDLAAGIWALALQSLLLVAIGVALAMAGARGELWVAVGLTFVVKVIAVPLVLRAALARVRLKREVSPVLPDRVMVLAAVALALLAYRAVGPLALPGMGSAQALPVAVALVLTGMLMMVTRRKALSQVLGLVTLENGIYLAALVATEGLPLAVELAVLFDVLVGVIVLAIFTQRISVTFETINTDRLSALRDAPRRFGTPSPRTLSQRERGR